jgi:hypothetical protein
VMLAVFHVLQPYKRQSARKWAPHGVQTTHENELLSLHGFSFLKSARVCWVPFRINTLPSETFLLPTYAFAP